MPAKREAITSPSVPQDLLRVSSLDPTSEDIVDTVVSGVHLTDNALPGLFVSSSRLEEVTLLACRLRGLEAKDVILEGCDFSGSDLSESSFLRVEVRNCRLSGVDLSRSTLRDVKFTDCKLEGISLRMTEGERVWILDSTLRDADLYSVRLRSSRILASDLSGTEFSQADLSGTQLQGSRLDGAKGAAGLHGVEVDAGQAMLLSELMLELHGISVRDSPEE